LEPIINQICENYIYTTSDYCGFIKVDDIYRLKEHFERELLNKKLDSSVLLDQNDLYGNTTQDHLYQFMKSLIKIFAIETFQNFFTTFRGVLDVCRPTPDIPDRTKELTNCRRNSIFSVCLRYEAKNSIEINKIYDIITPEYKDDQTVAYDTEGTELSAEKLIELYGVNGPSRK
jgi:hypothetical protein